MNSNKKRMLEAAGFKIGGVQEFLGLSDGEMALINSKVQMMRPNARGLDGAGALSSKAIQKKHRYSGGPDLDYSLPWYAGGGGGSLKPRTTQIPE
jgi:hypothetical protein